MSLHFHLRSRKTSLITKHCWVARPSAKLDFTGQYGGGFASPASCTWKCFSQKRTTTICGENTTKTALAQKLVNPTTSSVYVLCRVYYCIMWNAFIRGTHSSIVYCSKGGLVRLCQQRWLSTTILLANKRYSMKSVFYIVHSIFFLLLAVCALTRVYISTNINLLRLVFHCGLQQHQNKRGDFLGHRVRGGAWAGTREGWGKGAVAWTPLGWGAYHPQWRWESRYFGVAVFQTAGAVLERAAVGQERAGGCIPPLCPRHTASSWKRKGSQSLSHE